MYKVNHVKTFITRQDKYKQQKIIDMIDLVLKPGACNNYIMK